MPGINKMLEKASPITGTLYDLQQPAQQKKIGYLGKTVDNQEPLTQAPSKALRPIYSHSPEKQGPAAPKRAKNPLDIPYEMLDIADMDTRLKHIESGFRMHYGVPIDSPTTASMLLSPLHTDELSTMFDWNPKWLKYSATGSNEQMRTISAGETDKDIKDKRTGKPDAVDKAVDTAYDVLLKDHMVWFAETAAQAVQNPGNLDNSDWLSERFNAYPYVKFAKQAGKAAGRQLEKRPQMVNPKVGIPLEVVKMAADPEYRKKVFTEAPADLLDGIVVAAFMLDFIGKAGVGKAAVKNLDGRTLNAIIEKVPPKTRRTIVRALLAPTGIIGAVPGGGGIDDLAKKNPGVKKALDDVQEMIERHEATDRLLASKKLTYLQTRYEFGLTNPEIITLYGEDAYKNLVKNSLDAGFYTQAVKEGKTTADDVKAVLDDAGLKATKKYIKELEGLEPARIAQQNVQKIGKAMQDEATFTQEWTATQEVADLQRVVTQKIKSGEYIAAIKEGRADSLDAASEIQAAGLNIPEAIRRRALKDYEQYRAKGVKDNEFIRNIIQNRPPRPIPPEKVVSKPPTDFDQPEPDGIIGKPGWGRKVVDYLFMREGEVVERTPAGNKLVNLVKGVRDTSERRIGKEVVWLQDTVKSLDSEARSEVSEILDKHLGDLSEMPPFKQMPKWADSYSPEAVKTAMAIRRKLTSIRTEAVDMDIDMGLIESYFPHYYPIKMFEDRNFTEELAKTIAKTDDISIKAALDNIANMQKYSKHTVAGHLEVPRRYNVPGYSMDVEGVLNSYFSQAFRRIEEASAFGPRGDKANQLLEDIFKEGGTYYYGKAQKFFDDFLGKIDPKETKRSAIYAPLQGFTVVTKMGLSAIANASQKVNVVLVSDMKSVLQGIGDDILRRKDATRYATEVGALLDHTIKETLKIAGLADDGLGSKFLKWTGFQKVEARNRVFSSAVGKRYTENAFAKFVKKGEIKGETGRRLSELLGEDTLAAALKRGYLTDDEIAKGAKKFSDMTQFRSDKIDMPEVINIPEGKLVLQLQSYAYHQTRFLLNTVVKEAVAHGNLRPLLAFAVTFPIVGEVVGDIYTLVTKADVTSIDELNRARNEDIEKFDYLRHLNTRAGRPIPEDSIALLERAVDNTLFVGGLGIVSQAYKAAQFGDRGIYNMFLGVNLGYLADWGVAAAKAYRGEGYEAAAKQAIRAVPIVGPMAARQIDIDKNGQVTILSRSESIDRKETQRLAHEKKKHEAWVKDIWFEGDEALAEKMAGYYNIELTEEKTNAWFWDKQMMPQVREIMQSGLSRTDKLTAAEKVLPEATAIARETDEYLQAYHELIQEEKAGDITNDDLYDARLTLRDELVNYANELGKRQTPAGQVWREAAEWIQARNEALEEEEIGPSSEVGREIQKNFMAEMRELASKNPEFATEFRLLGAGIWNK